MNTYNFNVQSYDGFSMSYIENNVTVNTQIITTSPANIWEATLTPPNNNTYPSYRTSELESIINLLNTQGAPE